MRLAERNELTRDFICKSEIAFHYGCDIHTIDKWVAKGTVPPPHSRLGKRYVVWLRKDYREMLKTGDWPKAAYTRSQACTG